MVFVWVVVLLSVMVIALLLSDARAIKTLPKLVRSHPKSSARVTIVIPARNEARAIARCLDGALSQDGSETRVLVVDDGSTDDTPRILAGYAARFPERLRVINGRPLPTGWVGKCNACFWGASATRAEGPEWLLFLDADTAAQPGLVSAALAHAERHKLDAFSVIPFNELVTLGERMTLPVFFQFIWAVFPIRAQLNPEMSPGAVVMNGQCVFVRSARYWAIDGHTAVRDKVLEDMELGRALRASGARVGVVLGPDQLRVRMYQAFDEVVEGLGKHAVAGRKRAGFSSVTGLLRMLLITLGPPVLLLCALALLLTQLSVGAVAAALAAAVTCSLAFAFWRSRYAFYGLAAHHVWFVPLGMLVYLGIVVRATLRTWLGRGVTWKGRAYAE
jgi:chlorobactene glucosyltransferase